MPQPTPPTAALSITAPLDPTSVGLTIHLQAFVADLSQVGTYPTPVFVSDVGTMVLGSRPNLVAIAEDDGVNTSFYGNPLAGGYFRIESSAGATHLDIIGVQFDASTLPWVFDTDGNFGLAPQGFFDDGNLDLVIVPLQETLSGQDLLAIRVLIRDGMRDERVELGLFPFTRPTLRSATRPTTTTTSSKS